MWGPYRHRYFVAYTTVGLTWFFLASFIAISVSVHTHGSDFYYTPVGYWCWIGNRHRVEQFTGQYMWIWIAMFVSFLTYVPLFFWARGNITVSPMHWWKFMVRRDNNLVQDIDPDGRKRRSICMIVYPIVFAVVALPYSVIRWRTHFGSAAHGLPNATFATFAAYVLYGLSGAFNVLLFLFTRPYLLLPRNIDFETWSVGTGTRGSASTIEENA
ncbi:hypothetical protein PILCRDRAFT_118109 [Piloderma croceum F 1598]|uniref:Glucose receptor Git3 N-terminal domain-containing protein n=1 Tax=Piloderma croceum (strain F 1598) TaxID=765440 RepID=A0A0C3G7T8_PILCF|nr:hypothetical protein PILCRDRAFT_118109 [Piloderma croceum F 1598]